MQKPRGLFDILPYGTEEKFLSHIWEEVEKEAKQLAINFGFKEIRTPIFEKTELFTKSSGESSDIVKKEMYNFFDKKNRPMTLRPEGTAPVMRSFLENSLYNIACNFKFFYIAPMFRYDRPQKGRYRQHHQFGTEMIGNSNYLADVEIIELLVEFFRRLKIKNVLLQINSVGDIESRENYKKELKKFLTPHFNNLSEESKIRFHENILRILDSKNEKDRFILKNEKVPSILKSLNKVSKNHFDNVCNMLQKLNIPFTINDQLVRGLDYYDHSVFEVISSDDSNSLGGGGRYDGLLKKMGKKDFPGIGFGCGMERVIEKIILQNRKIEDRNCPFICFIPLGENAVNISFEIVTKLRREKISTDIIYTKKLDRGFKKANNLKPKYVSVLGDKEIETKIFNLKNMETREQIKISENKFLSSIKNKFMEEK